MVLRPLEVFPFFQFGDCLYTSESDVNRRQFLTYKDGPRAKNNFNRLSSIVLADQITVIGNEISVSTSRFENVSYQIKQIGACE